MISDPIRTEAYVRALRDAIRPGATVVEIGTGVGYFAIVACRAGCRASGRDRAGPGHPRRVRAGHPERQCRPHPVHPGPLRRGCPWSPPTCSCRTCAACLRSTGRTFPSVVDARRRLLKPEGALIPERDTMWVALTGAPSPDAVGPTDSESVDLGPLDRAIAKQLVEDEPECQGSPDQGPPLAHDRLQDRDWGGRRRSCGLGGRAERLGARP